MAVIGKPKSIGTASAFRSKKKDIPKGLWTKCPKCGEVLYNKELSSNLMVCPHCEHHMMIRAIDRILNLCDEDSFGEYDGDMKSVDVLKFKAINSYQNRLDNYKSKTGLEDAAIYGIGKIDGMEVSLAVIDFGFLSGSMGSVVGEKVTRAIERAEKNKIPLIIISASSGARMYEGAVSLMQMAKTSGALARLEKIKVPYISILTNPTMGGVTASFATLGDLILAEPNAMIGFAGPRVIKETIRQELPSGFQTAEFLLERGLIDFIIARKEMRSTLAKCLRYMTK